MKHTYLLLALAIFALFAGVRSATTPSVQAVGVADCFNQKLSAVLDSLATAANYVCTVNLAAGSALPDAYEPFGNGHAFPLVSASQLSFFEVYYATPAGGYCAVARDASDSTGQSLFGYYETAGSGARLQYAVDLSTGLLTGSLIANLSYDPTQRAWYQSTVAATGLYVTSTPYAFATTGLGVTAAIKCFRSGTLEIVGAADAQLSVLSTQTLAKSACSLFDNTTSVAYVVNTAGILVLQNDHVLSAVGAAVNSSTPLVKAAATWAATQSFENGVAASGEFTYSNTLYEFYSRPVSTSTGSWNWNLVIVRPSSDSCSSAVSSKSLRSSWLF